MLGERDLILSVGSAVAAELYGVHVPVVVWPAERIAELRTGDPVTVEDAAPG